jgi:hypothetical protein
MSDVLHSAPPEILAGLILVIVAGIFAAAIVVADARSARRSRLNSDLDREDLKRDVYRAERRAHLAELQRRLRGRA